MSYILTFDNKNKVSYYPPLQLNGQFEIALLAFYYHVGHGIYISESNNIIYYGRNEQIQIPADRHYTYEESGNYLNNELKRRNSTVMKFTNEHVQKMKSDMLVLKKIDDIKISIMPCLTIYKEPADRNLISSLGYKENLAPHHENTVAIRHKNLSLNTMRIFCNEIEGSYKNEKKSSLMCEFSPKAGYADYTYEANTLVYHSLQNRKELETLSFSIENENREQLEGNYRLLFHLRKNAVPL